MKPNMFKPGDKIVYLKSKLNINNHHAYYKQYQLENLYDIKPYYTFDKYNQFDSTIIYLEDYKIGYSFLVEDFILLSECRKSKLKNLKEYEANQL